MKSARIGPGWLVAAAFIGPGTVTTATLAGANYGTVLLWAFLFSIVATVVLQEMAARLGLVTKTGLGEAIRARFQRPVLRGASVFLVIAAIVLGNAAYETGNLLGAGLGVSGLFSGSPSLWAVVTGLVAAPLLWTGSYKLVERFMVTMVGLMCLCFLGTSFVVFPAISEVLSGLFRPSLPEGSLLLTIGLIGTTVAPYNLFLHASTVREKWSGEEDLGTARKDLLVSIALGGVVSMAVLITSAGTIYGTGTEVAGAADMARQLEPVLGSWAQVFFSLGLFAAGVTSAITAPLAAAYAASGALGWSRDLRSPRFRAVWGFVMGVGLLMAALGVSPVEAILFAQAANGVLLPAVACFLLLAVNDVRSMAEHRNGWLSNFLGGAVILVTFLLGGRMLWNVFTQL